MKCVSHHFNRLPSVKFRVYRNCIGFRSGVLCEFCAGFVRVLSEFFVLDLAENRCFFSLFASLPRILDRFASLPGGPRLPRPLLGAYKACKALSGLRAAFQPARPTCSPNLLASFLF